MTSKELYLRLLRYVIPYRRMFALSILGTVVLALCEPALAAIMKPLLDGSFVERDPDFIKLMPVAIIGLVVVRGIAGYTSEVAIRSVSTRVVMDIRDQMFRKILALPVRYFDDNPTGQTISKLTYDVNRVMAASTDVLITLVKDSLAITGLLAWMFYLNWKLSLIALLIAPPTALVIVLISRILRRLSRSLQARMGDLTNVIQETILGNRVVKVFGGTKYEAERFARVNGGVRGCQMEVTKVSEAYTPVVQLLSAIALAIVVYFAALQSQTGALTVGGFVSLFGAMAMLFSPIKRLTKINEKLQMGLAAAESIFSLLDNASEPSAGSLPLLRAEGRLELRGLRFAYRLGLPDVLKGLDLEIAAGENVAFVGHSGSGKSTLLNLIPRFYQAPAGTILLDGIPLEDLLLDDLRGNIAYVGQDTVLFNDTVAANIAYGAVAGVKEETIVAAAEAAHAMEFIRDLPDGLHTLIGENGVRLSGGQRQRIAIARALLKDAPILLLDEATSSLDSVSENRIQSALETLRRGRTSLIIAHRLSTIENADRIVVLREGAIAEIGDHQSLLEKGGTYADLYRLQVDAG